MGEEKKALLFEMMVQKLRPCLEQF